jgi:hypothetical protein
LFSNGIFLSYPVRNGGASASQQEEADELRNTGADNRWVRLLFGTTIVSDCAENQGS